MTDYLEGCAVCDVLSEYQARTQPLRDLLDRTRKLWVNPSYRYIARFVWGGRKRREARCRFLKTVWPVYRRWQRHVVALEAMTRRVQDEVHPQCPECGVLMGWTHATQEAEICGTCVSRNAEPTIWERLAYQRVPPTASVRS